MVSQCANPGCGAPFLYLRDGRLVAIRRAGTTSSGSVEFFWLCGTCATHLKIEIAVNGSMNVVPRPQTGPSRSKEVLTANAA